MKQRYIDFVPAAKQGEQGAVPARRPVAAAPRRKVIDGMVRVPSRGGAGGAAPRATLGGSRTVVSRVTEVRGPEDDFVTIEEEKIIESEGVGEDNLRVVPEGGVVRTSRRRVVSAMRPVGGFIGRGRKAASGSSAGKKVEVGDDDFAVEEVGGDFEVEKTDDGGAVGGLGAKRVSGDFGTKRAKAGASGGFGAKKVKDGIGGGFGARKAKMEFSLENGEELGVIEDLNARFVKTEVQKRPLSRGRFKIRRGGVDEGVEVAEGERAEVVRDEVRAAKAERVGNKAGGSWARAKKMDKGGKNGAGLVHGPGVGLKNGSVDGAARAKIEVKKGEGGMKMNGSGAGVYVPPQGKFINQAKLEKRPLSKTVYQKKVIVPKEEPKGLITIITKPEKQSHAGLIVTIILTIILGAAAGTVAFLLLPK